MKVITAIVQPLMLNKVAGALGDLENFPGLTVTFAYGIGRRSAYAPLTNDPVEDDLIVYLRQARIEIVAPDEMVDTIVQTIAAEAHTGSPGDGKVFVWPVGYAVRIHTGETDDAAL